MSPAPSARPLLCRAKAFFSKFKIHIFILHKQKHLTYSIEANKRIIDTGSQIAVTDTLGFVCEEKVLSSTFPRADKSELESLLWQENKITT